MPEPAAGVADVSTSGGIITVKITSHAIEEREAHAIMVPVKEAIAQTGDALRFVVLDLGEVNFINSSGLAACIELRSEADAVGARTIVYRPKDEVNQVFKMVRVDRLYVFAHSEDELDRLIS